VFSALTKRSGADLSHRPWPMRKRGPDTKRGSNPGASKIVMDALKRLNDEGRIELIAAVVMPDHIHFAARLQDTGLSSRMHSLKSYTSNKINPLLGRDGALWESQYYDHAIRTEDELNERVNYCLQKPVRRRLVERFEDYPQWYCAYKV